MFRLPLEVVMHRAAGLGIMPVELTYTGYNLDIVTGLGATLLFAALQITRVPMVFVWMWNLWGLCCLAVIAWIARSTSPLLRVFGDEPEHLNTMGALFPVCMAADRAGRDRAGRPSGADAQAPGPPHLTATRQHFYNSLHQ